MAKPCIPHMNHIMYGSMDGMNMWCVHWTMILLQCLFPLTIFIFFFHCYWTRHRSYFLEMCNESREWVVSKSSSSFDVRITRLLYTVTVYVYDVSIWSEMKENKSHAIIFLTLDLLKRSNNAWTQTPALTPILCMQRWVINLYKNLPINRFNAMLKRLNDLTPWLHKLAAFININNIEDCHGVHIISANETIS